MKKKQRTRAHIIADLSVNHVERYALLCGYTIERFATDYGYDVNVYTYNRAGEIENGNIYLQLKATDHVHWLQDGEALSFSITKKDLLLWLEEPLPVILMLYDAKNNRAYWLYIQAYFAKISDFDIEHIHQEYTVHIPRTHRVNTRSFRKFAAWKQAVLRQILNGRIHHNVENDTL